MEWLRKRSESFSRSCFMLIIKLSQRTKIRQDETYTNEVEKSELYVHEYTL
ncbi:hypothetical protein DAPPUDRAFT_258019 [Daphnia pulex]|uniref:Uncharacterized protein n=1 Tax=Daphnia pulex TaxID=6669 RepID=E9HEN0_DAPPU|nr:hypothetical protein DAPPUDRAFT_258019 [Daphnia pulex]|eukprot:EFX69817.1 hypothetical protein DAPPUDRAFT_258019 [Daphnia pulex]